MTTQVPALFDRLPAGQNCLIILNAGGVFRVGGIGSFPVVRDLIRSEGVLYRQSTSLRMQGLVEDFKLWEASRAEPARTRGRQGVLFALSTTMTATHEWLEGRPEQSSQVLDRLAHLKTSFGKFSLQDCRDLVYRGWWLAGASLALYHRRLLPTPLPKWEDLT